MEAEFPRARKRLGQHFLVDATVLDRIAGALALTGSETVVEIGPGRGALTDRLVSRARRVIAIELDRDLAPLLRTRYALYPHVAVIEADVLEMNLGELAEGPYVLAGNVPYYITTPILFHALEPPRPERAVFLVQREVAERLAAPPGTKSYGALTVNVSAVARIEIVRLVPPSAFRPRPTVDSAIIRLAPRDDAVVSPERQPAFRALVQGAFALRRKQMGRVLRSLRRLDAARAVSVLAQCGIDPAARPETLSPEQFARLLRALDE